MTEPCNFAQLRNTISILEMVDSRKAQLLTLQGLARAHGGEYDLPSERKHKDGTPTYNPLLPSLKVFGVHAMADDVSELPMNWLRAAQNMLDGAAEPEGDAA